MATSMTVEKILADYIANALPAQLNQGVLVRARCHLLDTMAAILSGRFLPAGKFGYDFAQAQEQAGCSTLLGSKIRVSAEYAAFANAMAAHADETDDSHILGRFHPGCAVIPVAISVAEECDVSAEAMLKAIVLGYDIGARSTKALGFSSPKTTVFSTHSFGALFGAAATAGALYGLNPTQVEFLMSFSVQQASGLSYWNRDPDHIEKSFDFGAKAARNGIFAARLAKAGMTGPSRPITGPKGYLEAFAESPSPEAFVERLGTHFEIEHSTIKKWPVGSPIQSVLDAVEVLFGCRPVHLDEVKSITIQVPSNRFHVINDRKMPAVCCQHLVALALTDGKVGFENSHSLDRMTDHMVHAWRKKINLIPDEALTLSYPERQAIVTVEMINGNQLRHHAKVVRGTPDSPMNPDEIQVKVGDILAGCLPDGGKKLMGMCFQDTFEISDLISTCLCSEAIIDKKVILGKPDYSSTILN